MKMASLQPFVSHTLAVVSRRAWAAAAVVRCTKGHAHPLYSSPHFFSSSSRSREGGSWSSCRERGREAHGRTAAAGKAGCGEGDQKLCANVSASTTAALRRREKNRRPGGSTTTAHGLGAAAPGLCTAHSLPASLLQARALNTHGVNSSSAGAPAFQTDNIMWSDEPGTVETTVTSIKQVTPTTKMFTLHVDDPSFRFKAGQWLDIFMPGNPTIGGFSIANAPCAAAASAAAASACSASAAGVDVLVAIKYAAFPPAAWMHSVCTPGATLRIRPGGDVCVHDVPKEDSFLFVCGGIGISPLHGMLQRILAQPGNGAASMLYSSKSESELLFAGSLTSLLQNNARFQNLRYFLTGGGGSSNVGKGAAASAFSPPPGMPPFLWRAQQLDRRLESADLRLAIEELGGIPGKPSVHGSNGKLQVHMCGPPSMIDAIEAELSALGVPDDQIHFERWW